MSSSPPEHTGNPESFLSRRYRGAHQPETEAEKLYADAGNLESALDHYSEELRFTARVLGRILKYEPNVIQSGSLTAGPEISEADATTDVADREAPAVEYEKLWILLKELEGRVSYYECDCLGRMERFLGVTRRYNPSLKKAVIAERDQTPQTEGKRLRWFLMELQEHFTQDKRRLKGLQGFIAVQFKYKGFDVEKGDNSLSIGLRA